MEGLQQLSVDLISDDHATRLAAAERLSVIGPDAATASIALIRCLGDPHDDVCQAAVAALEEMGPPPTTCLDGLSALALESDPTMAYWAVTLIGRLESDAITTEAVLVDAFANTVDASVQQRVVWALGKVGAKGELTLKLLEQAAQSDQPRLARLANQTLEQTRT